MATKRYDKRKFWKQRNGTLIEIKKMGNRHLINTIMMIERMYRKTLKDMWSLSGFVGGEIASDQLDHDIMTMEDEGPAVSNPSYVYLVQEAADRGLIEFEDHEFHNVVEEYDER